MTTTLRCTQRLLARVRAPTIANDVAPTTLLGDWYANLLHIGRVQLVLAVSERTFLPVVLPAAPISTLSARLRMGVGEVLGALAIPRTEIESELAEMAHVVVGRTSNRQVVGILVEFAQALEFYVDDEPSLLRVALKLATMPCSPLYKTTVSPDRTTAAAFEQRGSPGTGLIRDAKATGRAALRETVRRIGLPKPSPELDRFALHSDVRDEHPPIGRL